MISGWRGHFLYWPKWMCAAELGLLRPLLSHPLPPPPPPPRRVECLLRSDTPLTTGHDFWSSSIGKIRTEILSTLQYKVSLENVWHLDFSFKNNNTYRKAESNNPTKFTFFCRSANVRFVVYLSFFFSGFLFQKIKAMKEKMIYNIRCEGKVK